MVTLALCILSGFFIDLMRALALRLPGPHMSEIFAVAAMVTRQPSNLTWMADLFGIVAAIIAIIRFLIEVVGRHR